jgi:CRISPR-associated endonuclease/helicase Cas3
MSIHSIHLKSVYSAPAESEEGQKINLPSGWRLSWHQEETLKALRDPNIDVVINTAMTGDGKSLAGSLTVLQDGAYAIAMYPTNELARDQEQQWRRYIQAFQPSNDPHISRISGQDLEVYASTAKITKATALETRTSQSEVLLTNPDILHYLHRKAYLNRDDSPDKLWGRIDKDFDLFIFDEFHVFMAPQIAGVINTMLLMRRTNREKKFLFLSATPEAQLLDRLTLAGFRIRVIDPLQEQKYQFPETPSAAAELVDRDWRQVTRSIDLNFIDLEPVAKASEDWLKQNASQISQHFIDRPGSKGAIILNSVAAVKRLLPFFQTLFATQGLKVSENTGLSGKTVKEQSLEADLVIGTSSIDVGVDFQINFLIFESSDGGNFIQRLGRLGRHDGYMRNGGQINFIGFTAYALVPKFFVERLFDGDKPPLSEDGTFDRPFFHQIIRENYRQINDFQGYYKRWAAVQSVQICRQLQHKTIKQSSAGSLKALVADYEKVFDVSLKSVSGCISKWEKEWKHLSGDKPGNPIREDAESFRGSSPLMCGIYDATETNPAERFKTYDLPGILSNLEATPMTKVDFLKSIAQTGEIIAKGRFNHCLAFVRLQAYREERSNWKFYYPGDLTESLNQWKVQVLAGIEVWQPDNPWIGQISKQLKTKGLVCYLLPRAVTEVRLRLQLPMHFQIYPICDRNTVHGSPLYSIAFGQSALLLDILAYRLKGRGGEVWVC